MEKIILVGGSASGKDYLMRKLIANGFNYAPKTTTRPIRKGEVDGVEYNYITNEIFESMRIKDEFIVTQSFNIKDSIWNYGISNESFETSSVFIMTPMEVKQLSKEVRKKCIIYYLNIPESIRRNRLSRRLDGNDSIDRRLNADREDFENFNDFDFEITKSGDITKYFKI